MRYALVFILIVITTYAALIWTNVIDFVDSTTRNNVGIAMTALATLVLFGVLYAFTHSYVPDGTAVIAIKGDVQALGSLNLQDYTLANKNLVADI